MGFARNRAVEQSRGEYLCFQDVDDIMLPGRIKKQYEAARHMTNAVSYFYVNWVIFLRIEWIISNSH